MPGTPSVAIESRKQAASRPRPPLPSAASGSRSDSAAMSTPKSASASRTVSYRSTASSALVKVRPIRNSIDR